MNKTADKSSFLERISKNPYTIIGAIILAIGISHFVLQVSYIQNENLETIETAADNPDYQVKPQPPVGQVITIEPEQIDVKKIKIIKIPEIVKLPPRRPNETVSAGKPVRKKEARETRAERLRRAERILTGV